MKEDAARCKWISRGATVAVAAAVIVVAYAWLSPGPVGHWAFDGLARDDVALRIYDDGTAHFRPRWLSGYLSCKWKRIGYNRADILCGHFAFDFSVEAGKAYLTDNRPPETLDPWEGDPFVMVRIR